MRRILFCAVVGALAVVAGGAQGSTPPAKKAPAKAGPPTAVHSTAATARKPTVSSHTATSSSRPATSKPGQATRTTASRGRSTPPPRTTWRARQAAPAPERYKEIQDALVTKGYLSPGDANGAWNTASTEALKKFQGEQNLDSSGKINALSLIALGLGPKHDSAAVKPPAQSAPVQELPASDGK